MCILYTLTFTIYTVVKKTNYPEKSEPKIFIFKLCICSVHGLIDLYNACVCLDFACGGWGVGEGLCILLYIVYICCIYIYVRSPYKLYI